MLMNWVPIMIHFTGDTHFGCARLNEYTRGFSAVEEHDETILDGINSVVNKNDILIIAGDFCHEKPGRYRPRIRCKHIVMVLGNHDREAKIKRVFGGNVYHQYMIKTTNRPKQNIWVCHYPPAFWPRSHYGSIAVYGHIHDNIELENMMNIGMPNRRSMDIGVDAAKRVLGDWRPFSEQEILDSVGMLPGHEEIWREIPGWESFYEVSTLGRVRSMDRVTNHGKGGSRKRKGVILKQSLDKKSYLKVGLRKNGHNETQKVHKLVLETFRGPLTEGMQSLHGPAGKHNNCLWNLSYGTQEENWGRPEAR